MSDETCKKIDSLLNRLHSEPSPMNSPILGTTNPRPSLLPLRTRPKDLMFVSKPNDNAETERKLKEIMKISGNLTINGVMYKTDIKDMEHLEELGNGTCGHVVKMRHRPSNSIIAVKQMRRSGNSDENKRIIMDIEVVLKSHDCDYIVHCLGCFITESEVWICMELMDTCFDKLLKRFKQPVPEEVLGKVTIATVQALSYLKDEHGVIHRDVKPSNILLDMKGNVKLCDFGISGRLVDSMAKTRSAGCAAYMAPERIEPDPENPDYDVRADVWSLGITLVELATGVFPYQDCKTDFEVLAKVIGQDPPSLPKDKNFSPEFRSFVSCCLTKDKRHRPKYVKLKNHPFIKKYQNISNVNVGDWYVQLIRNAEDISARATSRQLSTPKSIHKFTQQLRQNFLNGSGNLTTQESSTEQQKVPRSNHVSRLASFQQRDNDTSQGAYAKSYSPYQAYQNHLACLRGQKEPDNDKEKSSPYLSQHRRVASETRWRSPNMSPVPLRHHFEADDNYCNCGTGNPMILQRFYHQQKQQQLAKEAEESGKKKLSSYIKMQLSGDRNGRSSRHQSPEPPPRLNRNPSSENQSPLTYRRNFLETHSPNSTSLSRRYISPTPPVPPPRRLSESTSVPGSPQHLRTRFHYTPEPQRRLFYNNDIS